MLSVCNNLIIRVIILNYNLKVIRRILVAKKVIMPLKLRAFILI
jgi:hypothetical protein